MKDKKRLCWTKTVLTVYKNLPRFVRILETTRDAHIASGAGGRNFRQGYNNEELFERIIDLNYRRLGLINVKALVDEGMRRLPMECTELLKTRYFDRVRVSDIADNLGIGERRAYRKLDRAILKLYGEFAKLGYDEEKFDYEYKKEPFLTFVLERFLSRCA